MTTLVILKAADGVLVHGLEYQAPQLKAVMLLFHQAGSSKAEYATIAPRLAACQRRTNSRPWGRSKSRPVTMMA